MSVRSRPRPRLQLMRTSGTEVHWHRAARLHAKWLMADSTLILGSCNFTEASQRNLERSVRLEFGAWMQGELEAEYDVLFHGGERFVEGVDEASPPS